MQKFSKLFTAFVKDEDGIALTEYLILLGIVTGLVIAAVLAFGQQLGLAWGGWSAFATSLAANPPPLIP